MEATCDYVKDWQISVTRNLLLSVATQRVKSTQSLLNIGRKTRLGSSRANVRPVEPMQLPDVHLHVHVCWRADLASCRSTA